MKKDKLLIVKYPQLFGVLFAFLAAGMSLAKVVSIPLYLPATAFVISLISFFILQKYFYKKDWDMILLIAIFALGCFVTQIYKTEKPTKNFTPLTKTAEKIDKIFSQYLHPDYADFASSIFLGKAGITRNIKQIFSQAGTAHIIVISGMHTAMVASVIFFFAVLFNIPLRWRYMFSGLLLMIYAGVCGWKIPVTRAAVMFLCFCITKFAQRQFYKYNALFFAAFFSVLISPESLFTASFQLSFMAVLFIFLGNDFLKKRGLLIIKNEYLKAVCFALAISFFASLGTLPLISYYFGKIFLLSFVSSVIAALALNVLISGIMILIIVSPIKMLASSAGFSLVLITDLNITINYWFSVIPFMSVNCRMPLWVVMLYYCVFAVIFSLPVNFIEKTKHPEK